MRIIRLNRTDRNEEFRKIRSKAKKPTIPLLILLVVLVAGTSGYYFLWNEPGSTIVDALYMTVITITTVGYGEVKPLDDVGRVFTMIISVAGIGSLFYVLSVWMENLFMYQLYNYSGKRKMSKKISSLEKHIILVGFGRVGKLAAKELALAKEEFVVIDEDFDDASNGEYENIMTIKGDATADETLLRAGVKRAKGMIVTTARSSTNVFIVLSAKVLNPNLFIVSRTDKDSDEEKLIRAGADRIVNPYSIGGVRLANLMINTNIIDFMDTNLGKGENKIGLENITLPDNSPWLNHSLKELTLRQTVGASILAVIRNEEPIINPDGDFTLLKGDNLVVVGKRDELRKIDKLASPK